MWGFWLHVLIVIESVVAGIIYPNHLFDKDIKPIINNKLSSVKGQLFYTHSTRLYKAAKYKIIFFSQI